jgi:hypothetical protein
MPARIGKPLTPTPSGPEKCRSEHVEQREFVSWFRQTFGDVRIFSIPNAGSGSRVRGGKLKAEGVSAGVPDLYVPAWRLWIEMKRAKGGRLSPEQRDWHAYLKSIGDTVAVCHGAADAVTYIREYSSRLFGQPV